jgi:L-ascorbate metabolism protein UlaG (beta-lactamase superfamily)
MAGRARLPAVQLIRYTHSCVRVEVNGAVLVLDPGTWSEPHALRGCDAVLVSHEHADHIDVLRLAGLRVPVYAPAAARIEGVEFTGLEPGQEVTIAGVPVLAVGGQHATVRPDQSCANLGYLVGGRLYHPGDALHVPDQPVETLLVPMQASWLKTAEAMEFARSVGPERSFGIHDGQLNDRGVASVNYWLAQTAGDRYRWLAPGQRA